MVKQMWSACPFCLFTCSRVVNLALEIGVLLQDLLSEPETRKETNKNVLVCFIYQNVEYSISCIRSFQHINFSGQQQEKLKQYILLTLFKVFLQTIQVQEGRKSQRHWSLMSHHKLMVVCIMLCTAPGMQKSSCNKA